jgi:hypothetical protein
MSPRCVYMRACVCVCVRVWCVCACVYYRGFYGYEWKELTPKDVAQVRLYACVCVYVYMYVCVYIAADFMTMNGRS